MKKDDSNYPYCFKTNNNNLRTYRIIYDTKWEDSLITLDLRKFNKEELDFIDELIKSLDKDNVILANQIILSKYE